MACLALGHGVFRAGVAWAGITAERTGQRQFVIMAPFIEDILVGAIIPHVLRPAIANNQNTWHGDGKRCGHNRGYRFPNGLSGFIQRPGLNYGISSDSSMRKQRGQDHQQIQPGHLFCIYPIG